MFRITEITDKQTRQQIEAEIAYTQTRACAILEHGIRGAGAVSTEYDRMAYCSGFGGDGDKQVTIETCGAKWTPERGLSGVDYLPSHLIPYQIEEVYRAARKAAQRDGYEAGKAEAQAEYAGVTLYRRLGRAFARLA